MPAGMENVSWCFRDETGPIATGAYRRFTFQGYKTGMGRISVVDHRRDIEAIAAEIGPTVKALQIIHGALMGGVLFFFTVMIVLGLKFTDDPTAVSLIPIGVGLPAVMLSFFMPAFIRQAQIKKATADSSLNTELLQSAFQTGHIVGMALLEFACFVTCFALTGSLGTVPNWFLAIPVTLLMLMAIRFPRKQAVVEWIVARLEESAM